MARRHSSITSLVPLMAVLLLAMTTDARAESLSGIDFERKVLDVIKNNPEAILESLSRYSASKEKEQEAKRFELTKAIQLDPAGYINDSPVFGSRNVKNFLFVFADFQCPYCAQVRGVLDRFISENHGVALVYKNYPLTQIHPQAMEAARAAWAAQQQGKFWQFHDILYANQKLIGEELFLKAAKELGLNISRFNKDRSSNAASMSIQRDTELAELLGISGTPFFLLNGSTFSGVVDDSFLRQKLK